MDLMCSSVLDLSSVHNRGGARKNQVVEHNVAKAGTVRNASFFEKLGQLFPEDDEGTGIRISNLPSCHPAGGRHKTLECDAAEEDVEQVLSVYEINDLTGHSPAALQLTPKKDAPFPTLGDVVPYTNEVYDASGNRYLGLSAGLCTAIRNGSGTPAGGRYETTYTHYFGDFGQLSAMGPYYSTSDSEMVVTGGTGIFKGARGNVKLHSVKPPIQILYTYHITGIQKLPSELTIPVETLKN